MPESSYRPAVPEATFPDKVMGQHRWMCVATHTLTEEEARKAQRGERVNLDTTNLCDIMVGCLDCEEAISAAAPMCPAPGFDWRDAR